MTIARKTIRVTDEIELLDLLDDAAKEPVIIERDGDRFRLGRDDDIAYEPDPQLVRATLAATAGSWADLDIDRVIRELHEARETGTRPLDQA